MTQRWWALSRGDLDTTVAQVGFNLAQMVIPVFLLLPVGISAGFSVTHLLPGLRLRFFDRIAWVGFARRASCQARRPNRCHRARLRQQCAGHHRLHALDHASGVSRKPRRQPRLGDRRCSGGLDRNHQACGGALRRRSSADSFPQPAAMTVFGAAMYSYLALVLLQRVFDQPLVGPDRARHCLHQRPGQHARSLAGAFRRSSRPGSSLFRWRWPSDMFARPGPDCLSSFHSSPHPNLCAP